MGRVRFRSCLLGIALLSFSAGPAARPQETDPLPPKIDAYLAAALAHKAGEIDQAAESVAFWTLEDLRRVVNATVTWLPRMVAGRTTNVADALPYVLVFRRYGITDQTSLNRAFRLMAFLHADIAVLHQVPDGYTLPPDDKQVLQVDDGRLVGQRRGTFHWDFAREVLERQIPRPTDDSFARLWYRATSAFLQQVNELAELVPHLARGRVLFPADPPLLLFDATMREAFAEPRVQNFVGVRGNLVIRNATFELSAAETRLRTALEGDPAFAEAHLRLGRVRHLQGDPKEAVVELDRALSQLLRSDMKYYALVYLGRAHHALGNDEAARQAFESAKTLYPNAQSPWIGLSQVARDGGDRDAATRQLQLLGASPIPTDRDDPLWVYRMVHDPSYHVLINQLRETATNLRMEAIRAIPARSLVLPTNAGAPR